jgi:hypothetical protein
MFLFIYDLRCFLRHLRVVFECEEQGMCGFELEMLQLETCVVYNHSNRLGRMWTLYFVDENGVSLVTSGFL